MNPSCFVINAINFLGPVLVVQKLINTNIQLVFFSIPKCCFNTDILQNFRLEETCQSQKTKSSKKKISPKC